MIHSANSDYHKLQLAAISLVRQLEEVTGKIPAEQYSQPLALLSHSSLGQHTRHIIEFFQCLFSMTASGTINYDLRQRNGLIESSAPVAIDILTDVRHYLEQASEDRTLYIAFNFDTTEESAPVITASSLSRELAYNIEHCTHHMAIIKIGILSMEPDFVFPEHFGLAASTVNYQKTVSCAQ